MFSPVGDPRSVVHGFVHDGIFEGKIRCGDGNEFHVESAKQYKQLDHKTFHSIIYNTEDVVHPKRHLCGGIMANGMNAHHNMSDTGINFFHYDWKLGNR